MPNSSRLERSLRIRLARVASWSTSRTLPPSKTPWRCSFSTMRRRMRIRLRSRTLTLTTPHRLKPLLLPWPWASRVTMEPLLLMISPAKSPSYKTWIPTPPNCCPKSPVDTQSDMISSKKWHRATNSSTWFHGITTKSLIIWKPSRRGQMLKRSTAANSTSPRSSYLAKLATFSSPTASSQWLTNA